MSRQPGSLITLAVALALTVLLPLPAALASHGPDTLPILAEDPRVADALAWLDNRFVGADGCVQFELGQGPCQPGSAKWLTIAASSAGRSPSSWPAPDGSVLGWLLDHADDTWNTEYRPCLDQTVEPPGCWSRRTFSLATSVLAFRAGGIDPYRVPLPDGGERDLVSELLDTFGVFQFGSPQFVNDDIWALIALNSISYEGLETQSATEYVLAAQSGEGSFGFQPGFQSVDTTAAAVMALAPRERDEAVADAISYLRSAQIQEGPTRSCWGITAGRHATAGSTAWAIQGLVAAGADPLDWTVEGQSPVDCLFRFQRPSGAFANSLRAGQSGDSFQATWQAIAGLSWAPYGALQQPSTWGHEVVEGVVGEAITLSVDAGFLRLGTEEVGRYTWVPTEPGLQSFHAFTWEPIPHPLTIEVAVAS